MGVFLNDSKMGAIHKSLPHACGGVSTIEPFLVDMILSSPRLWGCFWLDVIPHLPAVVFPTPVGVFLKEQEIRKMQARLPHACGGVSSQTTLKAGKL